MWSRAFSCISDARRSRPGRPPATFLPCAVFAASWPITLAPLDSCGNLQLKRDKYQKIPLSGDLLARALVENYRLWSIHGDHEWYLDGSTVLFDTVAVHLAMSEEFLLMEDHRLSITDNGVTAIDPANGRPVRCACDWVDKGAFEDYLIDRILAKLPVRSAVEAQVLG